MGRKRGPKPHHKDTLHLFWRNQMKKYYAKHPERVKASSKRYYDLHRNEVLEKMRNKRIEKGNQSPKGPVQDVKIDG